MTTNYNDGSFNYVMAYSQYFTLAFMKDGPENETSASSKSTKSSATQKRKLRVQVTKVPILKGNFQASLRNGK